MLLSVMDKNLEALHVHIQFCRLGCQRTDGRILALCCTGTALAADVSRAFDRIHNAPKAANA